MSDPQPPIDPAIPTDIPLEDIDRLLESEDPEFTKSLEEVRAVESDKDVTIDASAIDESLGDDDRPLDEPRPETGVAKVKANIRRWIAGLKAGLKAQLRSLAKNAFIFLKTRPKQFFFFTIKMSKVAAKNMVLPIRAFEAASRIQRLTALVLMALVFCSLWVLLANFKGIWLPHINEPILQSFEPFADRVETYQPKEEGENFYSAFPQERHEFLFPKMKVNLRRTADSPNPMGAFEVIVLLDSKDTAIEVRDREVEFSDLLQRVFEEESFTDLESDLGKSRLKSRLKQQLSQKLTQGWAKDISFKTFILKP